MRYVSKAEETEPGTYFIRETWHIKKEHIFITNTNLHKYTYSKTHVYNIFKLYPDRLSTPPHPAKTNKQTNTK